jgi:hypothetical protein
LTEGFHKPKLAVDVIPGDARMAHRTERHTGPTAGKYDRNSLKYPRKAEPLQGTNLVSLQFYQHAAPPGMVLVQALHHRPVKLLYSSMEIHHG